MRKVCLFNNPPMADFHGYRVETFDPLPYFPGSAHWGLDDLFRNGTFGYNKRSAITVAAGVDRLYRERDPGYMRLVADFVDKFRDFDLIVMGAYNFLHPEVLTGPLRHATKILGFIDDPYSSYTRGIPYLWAFDGAFYISPSYIDNQKYEDAVARWWGKPAVWWPLVPHGHRRPERDDDAFFGDRDVEVVYVGNHSATKVDRLTELKNHFGSRMRVHGRWPLKGYMGMARGLLGKPVYPYRVLRLSQTDRTALYWRTRIGFNMHVSDRPYETGNTRMYETPAHGMMMVCDKGGADAHAGIFAPGTEAIYYDSTKHAIELMEHFLHAEDERVRIARGGYERFWRDYEWEASMLRFLDWGMALREQAVTDRQSTT